MNPPARRKRRAFDWSAAVIATLALSSAAFVFFRDGPARFLAILTDDVVAVRQHAAEGAGGLPDRRVRHAAAAARDNREMGRRRVRDHRHSGCNSRGRDPAGRTFTIYPVAGAFLAAGADVGAACAFVISWTLIGYTRAIVWELPFFGLDFVTWRILFSLPLPILSGLLARYAWRFFRPATP